MKAKAGEVGRAHVMIVACPSLAFAFVLLLISHDIITAFACMHILHLVPVLFSLIFIARHMQ